MECRRRETKLEDLEQALDEEAKRGGVALVEIPRQPSRTYLVVERTRREEARRVRLGGLRAEQPRRQAPGGRSDVYRLPNPRRRANGGAGRQTVFVDGTAVGAVDWNERGIRTEPEQGGEDWNETWSAGRIEALRGRRGTGKQVWRELGEGYARPAGERFEPMTEVLRVHARTLPPVLARLARSLKTALRRTRRLRPAAQAHEVDAESYAWLMRQSGRTAQEKAHRGIVCPVRVTTWDTPENRVVRDFVERTVREIDRSGAQEPVLDDWRRRSRWMGRRLGELGVGPVQGVAKTNQVLRLNLDYQRVWSARKELLDQAERKEQLWCWQGETWSELALCLVLAAMAWDAEEERPEDGWSAALRAPVRLRRGQEQGRWIEADVGTAAVWVDVEAGRVLRLVGGGMPREKNVRGAACRLLMDDLQTGKQIGHADVFAAPPSDWSAGRDEGWIGIRVGEGAVRPVRVRPAETMEEAMQTVLEAVKEMG